MKDMWYKQSVHIIAPPDAPTGCSFIHPHHIALPDVPKALPFYTLTSSCGSFDSKKIEMKYLTSLWLSCYFANDKPLPMMSLIS